jgi:hypothetical protein
MPLSNYLAPSAIAKPGVCTSSTRPASPYEGQFIYETDTDKLLAWNGSAWNPPWNTAWGKLIEGGSTATTAFTGGTALEVLSVSGTVVAGRGYKISGRIGVQPSGSTTPNALYYTAASITKTLWYNTAAIGTNLCAVVSGFDYATASDLGVTSGSSSVTFKLYWKCGSSGGLSTNPDSYVGAASAPHRIVIEDIGPA